MRGKLYIVCGKGLAGSDFFVRELCECGYWKEVIPITTRGKRDGEKDGETYIFVDDEEFEVLIAENKLFEWNKYGDIYYGTLIEKVQQMLDDGKNVVIHTYIEAGLKMKKKYPDSILLYAMLGNEKIEF